MRTLDILVPQYKETDEIIRPLLDSIAIQQNIDFSSIGVIIVNDGTDVKLSESLLNNYPYKIEYYQNEHKGVSATRNACLDHSEAEYVIFCDADDLFYSACGIWMVTNELKKAPADVYGSQFVEETRTEDGQVFYLNRDNDSTFVHGKILRRQFLIDNHIRWNENLTIHEDSYFNCLAQETATNFGEYGYKYCPTSYYLWKWRPDSVCRSDPWYLNKTYNNMIESNTALVKGLLDKLLLNSAIACVVSMVYETYFSFNEERWQCEEGKVYLPQTEKCFQQYWNNFKEYFYKIDTQSKIKLVTKIRTKHLNRGLIDVKITFDDWIKHIEEL